MTASKAREARAELAKIWADGEKCGHAHARRVFVLLNELETGEVKHIALVLAAAKVVRAYIAQKQAQPGVGVEPPWEQLVAIVDAEVKALVA